MLRQANLGKGKVKLAVEERTLPLVAQRVIQDELPNVELVDAGSAHWPAPA